MDLLYFVLQFFKNRDCLLKLGDFLQEPFVVDVYIWAIFFGGGVKPGSPPSMQNQYLLYKVDTGEEASELDLFSSLLC